jgi:hypothetical protein
MSQFIQVLESRTLFSSALLADKTVITADAAAVKASAKVLAAADKTALAAVTADLKTLPKTDAPLLKTVKTDISKLASLTASDASLITGTSSRLATKSVTAGDNLQLSWSLSSVAAVTADANQLNSVIVAPLGKLSLALNGPLVTDLGVIGADNPTAAQLQADITNLDNAYAADAAALTSASNTFGSSLAQLSTDLSAVTVVPNIVFDYVGTIKETAGPKIGKSLKFDVDITTEDANGAWSGTYTGTSASGATNSYPAEGTVNDLGDFSGNLANGTFFTGTVSGKSIKGTAQDSNATGKFVTTHR